MFWEVAKAIGTIVGGSAVLAALLAWLTKTLLTHWMDKTLAQHKAHLDIESTNAMERLRSELKQQLLEHEVRYRRNDAQIAERLNEIYVRLFVFYEQVRAGKIIDVESVAIMDGNFGCDGQCGVE